MASIDDLVRISGYSRSTVFRFLAGKPVRPAAREAVQTAVRESGFRAGPSAPRSDVAILVSTPPGFQGFRGFADAIEGVISRASELGVPVVFDEAHAAGRRFGAIVLGKGIQEEDEERIARRAAGVPCVLVNRLVEDPDASWVSADFREAAAEAAERLAAAGCRRVACRAAPENRRVDVHKEEGFRRGADLAGIEALVIGQSDADIERVAKEALAGRDRPDGWFTMNDEDAMRVIRAAASIGLRVPGDLSVIGMNDVEGAAYFSPSLTSVRIPFRACGAAAVGAVLRLLDDPLERSIKILMRHGIAERESCAPIIQSTIRSQA